MEDSIEEPNEVSARIFPIDFNALNKGDVIGIEELERITSSERDTAKFRMRCLRLKNEIEREMQARGLSVTVRFVDNTHIKILTDSEAAKHNEQDFERHRKGSRRALTRQAQVDIGNLSVEERKLHQSNLMRNANAYQGLMRARRNPPELQNYTQKVPGLPVDPDAEAGNTGEAAEGSHSVG